MTTRIVMKLERNSKQLNHTQMMAQILRNFDIGSYFWFLYEKTAPKNATLSLFDPAKNINILSQLA